ncbi:MAG: GtrA family protein [Oscillospiraceae bacterium]|nr:GtrA family protein [Oscillospiraceae bacterium]
MTEEKKAKLLRLFWEFFRYALVGGIAFLVDYGTLILFRELILTGETSWELMLSAAAGFVTGLVTNYVLSLVFVFRKTENSGNGKNLSAFIIFTVIGLIGLGLTELIMYLGTELLHISYLFVKIAAAAIVLVWNYVGRKLLIFNKKGKVRGE